MFITTLFVGMFVLASWAITNIILWLRNRHKGSATTQFFWQMNGLWNIVNLLIAVLSTILVAVRYTAYSTDQSLQFLQARIVAANIILDVLYIAFGFWLEKRGKTKNNDRFIGYGSAIQLQGAFLFFFDSFFALILLVSAF